MVVKAEEGGVAWIRDAMRNVLRPEPLGSAVVDGRSMFFVAFLVCNSWSVLGLEEAACIGIPVQ